MNVALVNQNTVASDAELDVIARAVYHQVRYHFGPAWGRSATVMAIPKGQAPPPSSILVYVRDTSDQPGALGYHDDSTVAEGFVFAKTDQQYGALLSVTVSHEILELLADPDCQRAEQDPRTGYFYALEVGDPVEADTDGYSVTTKTADGVSHQVVVSDFILPAWYKPGSIGPWDYRGLLSRPFQVRAGGYVSIWKDQGGVWTQYQAETTAEAVGQMPEFKFVASRSPRQRTRGEL
jgi:hypothetical protein